MSYIGSDDGALCDGPCNRMYPSGWPDDFFAPWPVTGPVLGADGRMPMTSATTSTYAGTASGTWSCRLPCAPPQRALARRSRTRWGASQELLDQAEAVVHGSTA